MAEYINRQVLLQTLNESKIPYNVDINYFITNAPVVDVVEVVRCKDCMYKNNAETNHKGFLICSASGMEITDDDFCSYGKKVDFENDDI